MVKSFRSPTCAQDLARIKLGHDDQNPDWQKYPSTDCQMVVVGRACPESGRFSMSLKNRVKRGHEHHNMQAFGPHSFSDGAIFQRLTRNCSFFDTPLLLCLAAKTQTAVRRPSRPAGRRPKVAAPATTGCGKAPPKPPEVDGSQNLWPTECRPRTRF